MSFAVSRMDFSSGKITKKDKMRYIWEKSFHFNDKRRISSHRMNMMEFLMDKEGERARGMLAGASLDLETMRDGMEFNHEEKEFVEWIHLRSVIVIDGWRQRGQFFVVGTSLQSNFSLTGYWQCHQKNPGFPGHELNWQMVNFMQNCYRSYSKNFIKKLCDVFAEDFSKRDQM